MYYALLAAIVVAVVLFVLFNQEKDTPDQKVKVAQTLEEKLAVLAACGITLDGAFTVDDLLKSWSREKYEKPGFEMVLVGVGGIEEKPPWRNLSSNLWHFDTECIEGDGSYKVIVERMAELTQGALKFESVEDYVDIDEGEAWFSFKFNGEVVKVDCEVNDDWVDTEIFGVFVNLLQQADPAKVYIYYELGGQDCIIGCVTREQLKQLNQHGIEFVPLAG